MRNSGQQSRNRKRKQILVMSVSLFVLLLVLAAVGGILYYIRNREKPLHAEDYIRSFYQLQNEKKYSEMYEMITEVAQDKITKEDFIERYTNIMDGIEAKNIQIILPEYENNSFPNTETVSYEVTMDTLAGSLSFKTSSILMRDKDNKYLLNWDTQDIYPELKEGDKIKVSKDDANRGCIFDRNGNLLAGPGTAYSVGIVPGKLIESKEDAYAQIAGLLGISVDRVQKAMSASWVKDDSFVPIKIIGRDQQEIKDQLLQIKGIMISDVNLRFYPLGKAAAHITGYVQNITAEELEKLQGKGYDSNSSLGKAGLEKIYEDRLHGKDGVSISIYDKDGNLKKNMVSSAPQNGEDIFIALDANLQLKMYQELQGDSGSSIALNPNTGEVLAAVSTPAYDPNDFIMGYSSNAWEAINQDPTLPFYNRITGTFVPGSAFKPIVAAIGLTAGTLDPNADIANDGLQWQKDSSWGNYFVTTLQDYGPKNLQNALVFSDNIYFAKTAIGIGKDRFEDELDAFGFGESIPFELSTKASSYGTEKIIADEIELADSGYGQGKILVNPLHLVSLYAAFLNKGNLIQPTLQFSNGKGAVYWKENIFSEGTANTILQDMIQIVASENGTGHQAYSPDRVIAGKTGTAEIKANKNDTTGTEIGWFIGMTPQEQQKPVVMIMMIENVKERGGSHYVVPKVKNCLDFYYGG